MKHPSASHRGSEPAIGREPEHELAPNRFFIIFMSIVGLGVFLVLLYILIMPWLLCITIDHYYDTKIYDIVGDMQEPWEILKLVPLMEDPMEWYEEFCTETYSRVR